MKIKIPATIEIETNYPYHSNNSRFESILNYLNEYTKPISSTAKAIHCGRNPLYTDLFNSTQLSGASNASKVESITILCYDNHNKRIAVEIKWEHAKSNAVIIADVIDKD